MRFLVSRCSSCHSVCPKYGIGRVHLKPAFQRVLIAVRTVYRLYVLPWIPLGEGIDTKAHLLRPAGDVHHNPFPLNLCGTGKERLRMV
jgi:hypothetical protein